MLVKYTHKYRNIIHQHIILTHSQNYINLLLLLFQTNNASPKHHTVYVYPSKPISNSTQFPNGQSQISPIFKKPKKQT